jgi:hypothetical protein
VAVHIDNTRDVEHQVRPPPPAFVALRPSHNL